MKKTLIGLLLAFAAIPAMSQTLTFTSSITSGDEKLTPTLTWSAPGATSCLASGHASWTGSKSISGTATLPTITMSGTYQLALACTWAGDAKATLRWVPPTQNTDGSSLTNLAGYRIVYGTSAASLTQTVQLSNPTLVSYVVDNLTAGTWFFGVKAYNAAGAESLLSNIASKVITGSSSKTETIPITINPIPKAVVIEVE